MTLRIAFDLDGVLADLHGACRDVLRNICGLEEDESGASQAGTPPMSFDDEVGHLTRRLRRK